jgi:hypothetical protein
MNRNIAKVVVKGIGTLAALLGVGMLCVTPFLIAHSLREETNRWWLAFLLLPLGIAAYLIYVGYLVWFRFSPRAVRHVCGAVGFYLLGQCMELFGRSGEIGTSFAFLGCLAVVFFGYRFVSTRLSRWLFPADVGVRSCGTQQ